MTQEVTNFARFYKVFNVLPYVGSREDLKKELVLSYTNGRTDSLRCMRRMEYYALCQSIEAQVSHQPGVRMYREALKRQRSEVLHLMQKWGVNTADWDVVDRFCQDKRIAGKVFRQLDIDELKALSRKLRVMNQKKDNPI